MVAAGGVVCLAEHSLDTIEPSLDSWNGRQSRGESLRPDRQFGIGIDDRKPALALHVGPRSRCAGHGDIRPQGDEVPGICFDHQSPVQLPQQRVVRHASAREGDEDDGPFGFAEQPDFREGRMLLRFSADTIVRVEKYDVRPVESAPLPCPPRAPRETRRHRLTMKQCSLGPDRRLFQSGNAALGQRGEPRVKLFIE